jgi:hypothetical protein
MDRLSRDVKRFSDFRIKGLNAAGGYDTEFTAKTRRHSAQLRRNQEEFPTAETLRRREDNAKKFKPLIPRMNTDKASPASVPRMYIRGSVVWT